MELVATKLRIQPVAVVVVVIVVVVVVVDGKDHIYISTVTFSFLAANASTSLCRDSTCSSDILLNIKDTPGFYMHQFFYMYTFGVPL